MGIHLYLSVVTSEMIAWGNYIFRNLNEQQKLVCQGGCQMSADVHQRKLS